MSFIQKPKVSHPKLRRNGLGLSRRDYEGGMSTLCAGCGHDSITSSLIEAIFELDIEPHRIAKLSGIGCSSKTTAYFARSSHGFNSVHGRMPSVATGANAANRDLHYIGISGDGDSLSIGLGQFCHAIRRNLNILYIIENNGVYGLTKGQFSASADVGSRPKKGDPNIWTPIDPVETALSIGGTFVARSFSGDKEQLVPLMKAGLKHKGFALIDVISPCVTFNNHEGSTKSYAYTRDHYEPMMYADYIPPKQEITTSYAEGETISVTTHDGGQIFLKKTDPSYDPKDVKEATAAVQDAQDRNVYLTGLLYIDETKPTLHEISNTANQALNSLEYSKLSPGADKLQSIINGYR